MVYRADEVSRGDEMGAYHRNIQETLNEYKGLCPLCGKHHEISIEDICIGEGVLRSIPEIVKKHGHKVFMICDEHTWLAAGKQIGDLLMATSIPFISHIYHQEQVEPDEASLGSAMMHFDTTCDYILTVGSGTLHDIGKLVAHITGLPYLIAGTAPSMDGYASATSSLIRNGLKISLNSTYATAIVCDIDILRQAPMRLLQAGMGDMLAKYISICEWRMSHIITQEYYCPAIAELVRSSLKKCVENAEGLILRKTESVEAITEGLILCGAAMGFAGVSRPASGMEHYFSHIWDMRGQEFKTSSDLHGIQCGVATVICARIYQYIQQVKPAINIAEQYVNSFSWDEHKVLLRKFLGKSAEAMIALEEHDRKYDVAKQKKRFQVIEENWDSILAIIEEEIPKEQEIRNILVTIKAPMTLEALGHSAKETELTLYATKDIRDKYIGSRLLWDLGILEEVGTHIVKELDCIS